MSLVNAAPQSLLRGTDDRSRRQLPPEPEVIPQHCPIFPLFTQRGDVGNPQLVLGASADTLYGAKSWDYREAYATHQTVFRNVCASNANAHYVKRLLAPGAKQATLRLSIEVVNSENPVYQRDENNRFKLDENGDKIPDPNYKVTGHRVRWLLEEVPADGYGIPDTKVGTLQPHPSANSGSVQSTIYPILDGRLEYGSFGNNVGISLSAPTEFSEQPSSSDVSDELQSFIYRLKFWERQSATSTPATQPTRDGARFVDFAFLEDAFSDILSSPYSFDAAHKLYSEKATDTTPKINAPVRDMVVHYTNVKAVLTRLVALENDMLGSNMKPEQFNFVSGQTYAGVPYYTVEVLGPLDNGLMMSEDSVKYGIGGSDGEMTAANYEQAVRDYFLNWEADPSNYLDDAVWPISHVWDSGFSPETKDALMVPMSLRKDIGVTMSSQDVNRPVLNAAHEDSAIGAAIRTKLLLYPESAYHGTPVVRGAVCLRAGYLKDSEWTKPVPATVELINFVSRYMGASDGKYIEGNDFDQDPNNKLTLLEDLNTLYTPVSTRNKDWANGLMYPQSYSTRSAFFAGFCSAYPNKTSILSSYPVSFAVTELEKVAQRVWRNMTNSYKSRDAFIQESDRRILEKTRGRFDGRYTIVPETYFTKFDEASGYSWSCRIKLYGENSKYVGTFDIEAYRAEDLANG